MSIQVEALQYRDGEQTCQGYLAYNDDAGGPRPAVLVVHEASGLADHPKRRVQMLAELGYVAFALDMYGDGKVILGPQAIDEMRKVTEVPGLVRRRAAKGYQVLKELPQVDPTRIAAIGYCFGGACVIELARSGADLVGVASFHGMLQPASPEDNQAIKAKMLICTGSEDPLVPVEKVVAFQEELKAAGKDWQIVTYGGARHAFTNRDVGAANNPALSYNESADKRSWEALRLFLNEVFS